MEPINFFFSFAAANENWFNEARYIVLCKLDTVALQSPMPSPDVHLQKVLATHRSPVLISGILFFPSVITFLSENLC